MQLEIVRELAAEADSVTAAVPAAEAAAGGAPAAGAPAAAAAPPAVGGKAEGPAPEAPTFQQEPSDALQRLVTFLGGEAQATERPAAGAGGGQPALLSVYVCTLLALIVLSC